jgi:hypothetical protein
MTCEKCGKDMNLQYDVEERNVLFVLWACECGHKFLERRPPVNKLAVLADGA